METKEHNPYGSWLKYYRKKALNETIQQVALLIGCAVLYVFGSSF